MFRRTALAGLAVAGLAVAVLAGCAARGTPAGAPGSLSVPASGAGTTAPASAGLRPVAGPLTPIPAPVHLPIVGVRPATAAAIADVTVLGHPAVTGLWAMPTPAGTVVVLSTVRVDLVVKGSLHPGQVLTVGQIVRPPGGVIMGGAVSGAPASAPAAGPTPRTPGPSLLQTMLTTGHRYQAWLQPFQLGGHRTATGSYQVQWAEPLGSG